MMNHLANIALISFHALVLAEGVSRTGSFSKQPYTADPVMQFEGFNFYGEGIAYDSKRDRVLLGTMSNPNSAVSGRIYAVPYVSPTFFAADDDGAKVVYEESDMILIYGDDDERLLTYLNCCVMTYS